MVVKNIEVPAEFIRFYEAIYRLSLGMWAGLPRPVVVAEVKSKCPKGRIEHLFERRET
jgi:hypothetical protein